MLAIGVFIGRVLGGGFHKKVLSGRRGDRLTIAFEMRFGILLCWVRVACSVGLGSNPFRITIQDVWSDVPAEMLPCLFCFFNMVGFFVSI